MYNTMFIALWSGHTKGCQRHPVKYNVYHRKHWDTFYWFQQSTGRDSQTGRNGTCWEWVSAFSWHSEIDRVGLSSLHKTFFIPLALILHSLRFCGTNKEYIFALSPTNSTGGSDPVSLLNFPTIRWLVFEYSGWVCSKLLVSNRSILSDMSLYKSSVCMWQQKESVSVNSSLQRSRYLGLR